MPRQKILNAAFQLLAKDCYCCVTMNDIAQLCGIKKPSIYAHFSSKEQLFLQLLEREVDQICKLIDRGFENTNLEETKSSLYRFADLIVYYVEECNVSARFLYNCFIMPPQQLIGPINDRTQILMDKVLNLIRLIIEQGVDKGRLLKGTKDDFVESFICLLHGNLLRVRCDERADKKRIYSNWDIYWNGIKAG
jgi:AcrR family transcriptional regulator